MSGASQAASQSADGLTAWTNGRVIAKEAVLDGRALLTRGGRIVALVHQGEVPADAQREDLAGSYLAPGLIDIHTHGALGVSFLDGNDEAFATILEEQLKRGVTGLLATTSTAPFPDILKALETTRSWLAAPHGARGHGAHGHGSHGHGAHGQAAHQRAAEKPGTPVLGAHVEGPYFAAAQAGAQDPANLRTPDDGSVDELLEYADVIKMVSFAPELPGALELTAKLVELGIVAAGGHSEASDEQLARCEAYGLSHMIHLWSGQSTTFRRGPYREPGILEASLASVTLSGEIISDGKHLPATLLRLAHRAFGPERLCVVSDATSGAGLADGAAFSMGAMSYVVKDGVGMMPDGSAFAGSSTLLDGMLKVLTDDVGLPLHEVVRMASLTPATVIGLGASKGSLEAGKDADLAVFSPQLEPLKTVLCGRTAWSKDGTVVAT